MNMLEAIRATDLTKSVRFYQASTSELYGKVQITPSGSMTLCGWRTASWLVWTSLVPLLLLMFILLGSQVLRVQGFHMFGHAGARDPSV